MNLPAGLLLLLTALATAPALAAEGRAKAKAAAPSATPSAYAASVPKPTYSEVRYGGHAFGAGAFPDFLAARKKLLPWIAEYSPYALVSAGEPPVALFYNAPPALGQEQKDPTHTANFGVKLQERRVSQRVRCELVYPGAPSVPHAHATAYLIATLKGG